MAEGRSYPYGVELPKLLTEGWRVASLHPLHVQLDRSDKPAAYVVLER